MPRDIALIPAKTKAGVLGITRIMGMLLEKKFSINDVGIPAIIEINNCSGVITSLTSSRTFFAF